MSRGMGVLLCLCYLMPVVWRATATWPECESECSITSCQNGGTLDAAACSCACPAPFTGDTCGDCSISSCQNGGTLDAAACTCACPAPFTGQTCGDCSITSCNNGGTLDAAACQCACPAPYSGQTCDDIDCAITSCENGGTLDLAACSCACPFPYTGVTCEVPPVVASITCDDNVLGVFADGVPLGVNDNNWNEATDYLIPDDTVLFQVQCENSGGPGGFLASFSNGVVTDASWECSATGFDSNMAPAVVYDPNGSTVPGISSSANWIWTSNYKYSSGSGDIINYCQVTV